MFEPIGEVLDVWLALGQEVVREPLGEFVRNPWLPQVWDANCTTRIKARTGEQIEELLARVEEVMHGLPYRRFLCDARTPEPFEARLLLEGLRPEPELVQVLAHPARWIAPPFPVRRVDWKRDVEGIRRLLRCEHVERAQVRGEVPLSDPITRAVLRHRLGKATEVRTFLAVADGRQVAHVSAWSGRGGIGLVDHLYVARPFRGRGIARALLRRAITELETRGAGAVVLVSRPDDWPRRFYAKLGFRPVGVRRVYHGMSHPSQAAAAAG